MDWLRGANSVDSMVTRCNTSRLFPEGEYEEYGVRPYVTHVTSEEDLLARVHEAI